MELQALVSVCNFHLSSKQNLADESQLSNINRWADTVLYTYNWSETYKPTIENSMLPVHLSGNRTAGPTTYITSPTHYLFYTNFDICLQLLSAF